MFDAPPRPSPPLLSLRERHRAPTLLAANPDKRKASPDEAFVGATLPGIPPRIAWFSVKCLRTLGCVNFAAVARERDNSTPRRIPSAAGPAGEVSSPPNRPPPVVLVRARRLSLLCDPV